jgi:hypothetical protein
MSAERIVRRSRLKKWANRYSQIRFAAKRRGKPWQWRKWVDMWGDVGQYASVMLMRGIGDHFVNRRAA